MGAKGQLCWVEGVVRDTDGKPVAGARLDVWEADEDGFYDVQYDDHRVAARAHLFSDDVGSYRFWAITPTPSPIPTDGPVGQMLAAVGRSPMSYLTPAFPGLGTGPAHADHVGDSSWTRVHFDIVLAPAMDVRNGDD